MQLPKELRQAVQRVAITGQMHGILVGEWDTDTGACRRSTACVTWRDRWVACGWHLSLSFPLPSLRGWARGPWMRLR